MIRFEKIFVPRYRDERIEWLYNHFKGKYSRYEIAKKGMKGMYGWIRHEKIKLQEELKTQRQLKEVS